MTVILSMKFRGLYFAVLQFDTELRSKIYDIQCRQPIAKAGVSRQEQR